MVHNETGKLLHKITYNKLWCLLVRTIVTVNRAQMTAVRAVVSHISWIFICLCGDPYFIKFFALLTLTDISPGASTAGCCGVWHGTNERVSVV